MTWYESKFGSESSTTPRIPASSSSAMPRSNPPLPASRSSSPENLIRALTHHREQWQRLVAGSVPGAAAVEELIRYDPPLQLFECWVLADGVEVEGVPIPRGEKLALLFGAANRDPRVFADPDRFDVDRPNAGEHIGFGGGIHVCIGAPLARVELETSLRTIAEWRPSLELTEEPRRIPAFVIWGLERVDVALG